MEYRDIPRTVYDNLTKFYISRNIKPTTPHISTDEFSKIMRTVTYVVVEGVAAARERLPERNTIIVIFSPTSEASKKKGAFTKLLDQMRMDDKGRNYYNNTDLIFISNEKPVSMVNGYDEIYDGLREKYKQLHIEAYTYEKLFITPDNQIISKHEILPQAEVEKLNIDRLTDNSRRTIITSQDVAAVWLGARTGDVIKILCPSGETGYSVRYRVVK